MQTTSEAPSKPKAKELSPAEQIERTFSPDLICNADRRTTISFPTLSIIIHHLVQTEPLPHSLLLSILSMDLNLSIICKYRYLVTCLNAPLDLESRRSLESEFSCHNSRMREQGSLNQKLQLNRNNGAQPGSVR